jgi:hypothetical protein
MRYTILCRTAVWAFCASGMAHAALTSCNQSGLVPPVVTPSPAVLVGDMRLECETVPPGDPVTHIVDVILFSNAELTPNVIRPDGSLETVLLVNDPVDRVPGVNTFYARKYLGFTRAVVWEDVPLTFTLEHLTTLHITNIRLDTTTFSPLEIAPGSFIPAQVEGFLSIAPPVVAIQPAAQKQIVAYVQSFQTNVPEPASLPLAAAALVTGWLVTCRRTAARNQLLVVLRCRRRAASPSSCTVEAHAPRSGRCSLNDVV